MLIVLPILQKRKLRFSEMANLTKVPGKRTAGPFIKTWCCLLQHIECCLLTSTLTESSVSATYEGQWWLCGPFGHFPSAYQWAPEEVKASPTAPTQGGQLLSKSSQLSAKGCWERKGANRILRYWGLRKSRWGATQWGVPTPHSRRSAGSGNTMYKDLDAHSEKHKFSNEVGLSGKEQPSESLC